MSHTPSRGSLAAVFAHLPRARTRLTRLLDSVGLAADPSPVREPAESGPVDVPGARLPPFDRVSVARPDPDDDRGGFHGVTVWNAGPERTLRVVVESAGRGDLLETERKLHPDRPLRIELEQTDAYTVAVGDGDLLYEVDIEPAWFDRDAAVTDVVVDADGEVCYSTLAERGD